MLKEDIHKIAEHYGLEHQKVKCIEELNELASALAKSFSSNNINNIAEEIADVEIMLEQLKHLLVLPKLTIEELKHYKLSRQLKRMEKEVKE